MREYSSGRIAISELANEKATFRVIAKDTAIGNNKSMLSLLNDSGSTKVIRLRKLWIINAQNAAVTGVISDFSLLRFTGHSVGTSLTPQTYDTQDSLNSSVTARTGATIVGESATDLGHWKYSSDEWGSGAQDVESMDHAVQVADPVYKHDNIFTKPITLRAGEGIHLKHTVNSTAGTFDVIMEVTQE